MNSAIKALLGEQITISGRTFPVAHLHYEGPSDNYVTWSVSSENSVLSADDKILCMEVNVDIDIFTVGNANDVKSAIYNRFMNAGWFFAGMGSEEYFPETKQYHLYLNFIKERIVTNG